MGETEDRGIGELQKAINQSIGVEDPATCNRAITRVHYQLSRALSDKLGEEVGANFHSGAVWGSKKAGQTIRQEDLDSALRNATVVAGIFGGVIGMLAAWMILKLEFTPDPSGLLILAGTIPGFLCGALTGRAIARYSRIRAAKLVLEGNRTVLDDIGSVTARFVELDSAEREMAFLESLTPGPTGEGGRDLLRRAFDQYRRAGDRQLPLEERRVAALYGNCLAIYHEHIRLQPIIVGSMPWIIRRCVTQRMMQYEIGPLILSVAREFPETETGVPVPAASPLEEYLRGLGWRDSTEREATAAAEDWTRLTHRMRYVLELFRRYHLEPGVLSEPG